MTISDLITQLQILPGDWHVSGTRKGSLEIWSEDRVRYGYVFTDGRPTKLLTDRRLEAASETEAA